jgi:hypothetical protein
MKVEMIYSNIGSKEEVETHTDPLVILLDVTDDFGFFDLQVNFDADLNYVKHSIVDIESGSPSYHAEQAVFLVDYITEIQEKNNFEYPTDVFMDFNNGEFKQVNLKD